MPKRQKMSDIMKYRKTPILNIRLRSIPTKYMWKHKSAHVKRDRNITVHIINWMKSRWSFQYKPIPFQNKQKTPCSCILVQGSMHAREHPQYCGSDVRGGKSEALTTENVLAASNFLSWSTALKHDQRRFGYNWEIISHVYKVQLK